MAPIPGLRRLFRFPWRTRRIIDQDIDDELRFHLEMRAAELAGRRGLGADQARAEALRQFGDLEEARRYIRRVDGGAESASRRRHRGEAFRRDVAYAARGLRKSAAFSLTVILALALGIGGITGIFAVVNAVLIRPLPVPHPEQLVGFGDPSLARTVSSGSPRSDIFSYPLYVELRESAKTVSGLFASGLSQDLDIVVGDAPGAEPERLRSRLVSGNYFSVLQVRPAIGRTFTLADDRAPGSGPVAVISHDYWRRRFNANPSVVGTTIVVNRTPLTIVGVASAGFAGEVVGSPTDLWIPLTMQPRLMPGRDWLSDRDTNWLLLIGRLQPGGSERRAAAELTAIARPVLMEAARQAGPGEGPKMEIAAFAAARGASVMRREARNGLVLLLVLGGLVLLVVCADVANLLLARAAARRTEISVRLALGAGRGGLIRQMLTESLLLGCTAGALALAALFIMRGILLRRALPRGGASNLDLSLDWRVLGFAAVLSVATALLLGIVPALRATRGDLALALRSHARGMSGDPLGGDGGRFGLGKWLVVGQVSISLALLAGAGLLVQSARNLETTDVGFARDEILVVPVDAQNAGYAGARLHTLHGQLAERLALIPGVRHVTYSANGIFTGAESASMVEVPGFVAQTEADALTNFDRVGPGFVRAVGARILRGRDIEARDDDRSPRVAVINQTMASFYFGGRDPIGQSFQFDSARYEIVGVASDVATQSLRSGPTRRFYLPIAQGPVSQGELGTVYFLVRTTGNPAAVAPAARREILAVAPALRAVDAQPLTALVRRMTAGDRSVARLAGAAGGLAVVLVAFGLYGVMTYTIVRRTREFGLRMALGARPADITWLVLRESITLFVLGVVVGIPMVIATVRLLRHQLVGIGIADPVSLAAALGVLAITSALAGYLPANRAGRVAPHTALTLEG